MITNAARHENYRIRGYVVKDSIKHRPRVPCVLFLLLLALFTGCDEESKQHLEALKQIAKETPIYPGGKQVRANDNNKFGSAVLIICYNAPASYEEVRRFYSTNLIAKGWVLYPFEERRQSLLHSDEAVELVYRKGEYRIAIHQGDNDPTTCNYSVAYVWERG